ncbi:L-lactate dehydrogenase [Microbacterium sp. Mu-80]|uniref:L-lactate dehydrogenase n=1 Tax=Microbacterium bandirmense TaxID=3122050 RepID=A0ABU8LBJ7_9MICO
MAEVGRHHAERTKRAPTKLGIVGAGSVGSSLAYAALIRNSADQIALFDRHAAKVKAEVLDLAHGTPYTGTTQVSGGTDLDQLAGSDVVVVTAGAKQHPGQSRLELAGANTALLRGLMPQLVACAPDAIFLVITNPADVLTVVVQRYAALPPNRVFSTGTVLDSSRLQWMLARAAGVAVASVHAMIVGEHGDSQFPLWSGARIGPVAAREWAPAGRAKFRPEELDDIAAAVRGAAARVIAGKGATNYAIGLSAARVVEAVLKDEHAVLPVSSTLSGYHGLSGIALSVPTVVGAEGILRVVDTPMDDQEIALLHRSAGALRDTLRSMKST